MPTCEFCAEEITGNEINCPHCGSSLGEKPDTPKKTKTPSAPVPFLGILSIVFLVAGLGIGFVSGCWWLGVTFGLTAIVLSFLKKNQFSNRKVRLLVGLGGVLSIIAIVAVFFISLQLEKAEELERKTASMANLNKRMDFFLSTVDEVKNNNKRISRPLPFVNAAVKIVGSNYFEEFIHSRYPNGANEVIGKLRAFVEEAREDWVELRTANLDLENAENSTCTNKSVIIINLFEKDGDGRMYEAMLGLEKVVVGALAKDFPEGLALGRRINLCLGFFDETSYVTKEGDTVYRKTYIAEHALDTRSIARTILTMEDKLEKQGTVLCRNWNFEDMASAKVAAIVPTPTEQPPVKETEPEPTPEPTPEAPPTPEPEPEPAQPPPLTMVSIPGVPDISTNESSSGQKDTARALNKAGMAEYKSKDYPTAIAKFIEALEANPAAHVIRFNLGCSYALNGDNEKALDVLQQFKIKGCEKCLKKLAAAKKDSDFDSIRGNPRYQRIMEGN